MAGEVQPPAGQDHELEVPRADASVGAEVGEGSERADD